MEAGCCGVRGLELSSVGGLLGIEALDTGALPRLTRISVMCLRILNALELWKVYLLVVVTGLRSFHTGSGGHPDVLEEHVCLRLQVPARLRCVRQSSERVGAVHRLKVARRRIIHRRTCLPHVRRLLQLACRWHFVLHPVWCRRHTDLQDLGDRWPLALATEPTV